MTVLMLFFVFLFGLVVGSFLNALIYRLENGDSVLRGRSYCPHCKHTLTWYDLIPLASFAILGGRCRYCKQRISLQYPLVELATAILFLVIFKEFSSFFIFQTLYLWTVASLLIVLFVYDLRHYILPDKILLPAIGIVFLYRVFEFWPVLRFFEATEGENFGLLVLRSLGEGGGFGILPAFAFLAIVLISKGAWMGMGDVKLAAFMGLFLGWPNILVALFLAFLAGAAIGLALIILKKKGLKSEIPFGPFLIGGTFGALFWGEEIVHWYMRWLLV